MSNNFTKIIHFWFDELNTKDWWIKSEQLDRTIKTRFLKYHEMAIKGELEGWRNSAQGRLAEIIVLDQFSRNIYRNRPQAFEFDGMALLLAQEMRHLKLDLSLPKIQRQFCYMPYMHSESIVIHSEALKIFKEYGGNIDFEIKHKEIIERFGRYPHRNEILGRKSTKDEVEFLKGPGSSF